MNFSNRTGNRWLLKYCLKAIIRPHRISKVEEKLMRVTRETPVIMCSKILTMSRGTHTFPTLQSVIDKWILHKEATAPSGHSEPVKVKQAPPEASLRQLYPSKRKCAWGCTISLLLAFQSNPETPWTVTKGKDHFVVFPVAPPRPCCAHTRQSKRPLSVQIVHSRICDNLLSSLFIYPLTQEEYC